MARPLAALGVAGVVAVAGCAASDSGDEAASRAPARTAATAASPAPSATASATPGSLVLGNAIRRAPAAYRFARARGARVGLTYERTSYYVYLPPRSPNTKVIVTMHGYLSTAFDDFAHWYPRVASRGYGILAVHWRLGPRSSQSTSPARLYAQMRSALRTARIGVGDALLHAYSSAAYRIYGVAALDRRGSRFFGLNVAAAGGARPFFSPLYREVFGGGYGPRPLLGSRWVLFCGGRDPYPDATGCRAMFRTRGLIRLRGGIVDRFILDPQGNHGSFLNTQRHVDAALEIFARLSPL